MKYKQLIKNDLGKERLNENFALQSITGSCVYLGVVRKFGRHFTGFLKCVTACRIGLRKIEDKCNLTVCET